MRAYVPTKFQDFTPKGAPASTTGKPQSPGGLYIPPSGAGHRPGLYDASDPIVSAGYGELLNRFQNLYDYPEGRKRALMSGVEKAYGGAKQRYRGTRSAYGGEVPEPQARAGQQLDLERGAGMSDQMREWEDFIAQYGDEGLRTLLMPFLNMLAQSYGQAESLVAQKGMQKSAEPSDWEKSLGFLGDFFG
jgi:hypothetical protein